jgi:ankyrin repeat protein
LYIAAQNGHEVIVSYLLDKKIFTDPNQYFNLNEQTPIQVATKNGHYKVVKVLLDKCPKLVSDVTR